MSGMPSVFEVPQSRSFQFNGDSNGSVGQDVNLFQGALNFSVPLVSMSGRSGLNLDISAAYNSSVASEVGKSNRVAPTGVLGLGWELFLDRIDADYATAGNRDSATFYLTRRGTRNRLYRSTRPWLRGTLDASFAAVLDQGALDTAILAAFLQQTLVVDANAVVTVVQAGNSWSISDPVNECLLAIAADVDTLQIFDGGDGYEPESFDFSQVRYYPPFERWEIVPTDGLHGVFGGGGASAGGERTSQGDSILWGVKWNTWSGPSTITHDAGGNRLQSQYPLSWYLSAEYAVNRDATTYSYTQVRQPVGAGGLTYSKAIYLSQITDVFGRTAVLTYADKKFSTLAVQPREYLDPYKAVPDDGANAYQSRYETRYLAAITCRDATGALLQEIDFTYELRSFSTIPPGAPPTFVGDTTKRCLVSIRRILPGGASLPDMTFEYHGVTDINPGAMAKRVMPQGAAITYTYQPKNLTTCARNLVIQPALASATPRVWFGADYALVLWINDGARFALSVYTWIGRWALWRPATPIFDIAIDLADINVHLQERFFTLDFALANGLSSQVLFFHKDTRILGGWLESPASPVTLTTPHRQVVVGDRFFAVADDHANTVNRFTWDNALKQWTEQALPTPPQAKNPTDYAIFLAGASNILTALYYDIKGAPGLKQSLLILNDLDETGIWAEGSRRVVPEITIAGPDVRANFQWSASAWVFAATAVTALQSSAITYQVTLYTWGQDDAPSYAWNAPFQTTCQMGRSSSGLLPYAPTAQISPTGMVSSGPYLLRFNGRTWLTNDNLRFQSPVVDGNVFWFAPGEDIVLKTENTPSRILAQAQVFDPNSQSNAWSGPALLLYDNPPSQSRLQHYFPSAGADFISFNDAIYYRGTSTDWIGAVGTPAARLPVGSNSITLVNEAPQFLVYLKETGGSPVSTEILILNAGFVSTIEAVAENFYQMVDAQGHIDEDPNGKYPGGPSSFLTYQPLSGSFAQAQSLTLYRFIEASVRLPVSDYPVETVVIDDGYVAKTYAYAFDATTAAVTPQGDGAKYYRSALTVGTGNGRTEYTFFNSVGTPSPANPTQEAVLDGQLLTKLLYDEQDRLVSSQKNHWVVVDEIEDLHSGTTHPLNGVYVQVDRSANVLDGIETEQTFAYDLRSGQVNTTRMQTYNGFGALENHERVAAAGYATYPLLGFLNMLTEQVQLTSTVAVPGAEPVVSGQQIIDWDLFPGRPMGAAGSLQLLGKRQSSARTGTTGTRLARASGSDWQLLTRTSLRNPYGYASEAVNAAGLSTSTLYGAAGSPVVATFSGTSLAAQECYYYGFETYESAGSWALDDGVTPRVDVICNTGTRCLSLPPGATGATLELSPQNRRRLYLFSFWATIDPAAADQSIEAWRIDFVSQGPTPPSATISVTSREWRYYSRIIDLTACSDPVTVRFTPANRGASTVFLDDVCFASKVGQARICVYEPHTFLILAEVGPYDEVKRYVYDRRQRQIAFTSEFQAVLNIIAPYLSRQDQPAFNSARPNSQLALQPMGATRYERFRNNGVWSPAFTSATPAQWQSDRGVLRHAGSASGSIAWAEPAFTGNYAISFDLQVTLPASAQLGVTIGDNVTIAWDPASGNWTLNDTLNHATLTGAYQSVDPSGHWVVVLSAAAIIVCVEGRVLFAYLPAVVPAGKPAIFAGDAIAVSDFIIAGAPQVAVMYFDGAGKTLQGHSIEDDKAVVAAWVSDASANPLVRVKTVTYDGRSEGLIALRTDVVTAFDWDTGVLSGRAATAYPGDEGYPYIRTLLEASPLGRTIEVGAPGKLFAITNLSTTPASARHTLRYRYGSNRNPDINGALGWPADQYAVTRVTDQDGHISFTYKDKLARSAGSASLVDAGAHVYQFSARAQQYTTSGSQQLNRLPNYFSPPPGSNADNWVNAEVCDMLGRRLSVTTPDSGTLEAIYDVMGQTRFVQDAVARAAGLIVYTKYDAFSRRREKGVVAAPWDPVVLAQKANDPDWPTVADGARTVRAFTYDGDGASLADLGRLTQVAEFDETTGAPLNSLSYAYDGAGKVGSLRVNVADTAESWVTSYTYDNLGNALNTAYPSGYALDQVRDSVGRVVVMRDSAGVVSRCAYDNSDSVEVVEVLPGAANAVRTQHSYNSPGWLTQLSSAFLTETLTYTTGAYDGQPFYSGRIGSVAGRFNQSTGSFAPALTYAYAYDSIGRLTVAQATTNQVVPAWSLGLSGAATYDRNGNFMSVDDGGTSQTYAYTPGSDRVLNTDGGSDAAYVADANGAIVQSTPKSITQIGYELTTKRANIIRTGAGDVSLQYDGNSNRAVKTSGSRRRTYVRGLNGWPLVEVERVDGNVVVTTEYLYGPAGLFAVRVNGALYPVLTDHLQSVRGLVGPTGALLNGFHYSPFGRVVDSFGDASLIRYRFTGYEYDEESGLYNAAARLYDPDLKRFYSVDPRMQFPSPYLYAGNNPVSVLDPTGEEAAWWALLIGAVVGVIATLATGGAGAWLLGAEEGILGAETAVAATAGAVGSLAGDATTAGLAHEKFTAKRAFTDLLAGAAGGAAGELFGGFAAAKAMDFVFRKGFTESVAAVTAIGSVTSGVVGGLTGAAASGAVTSVMTGTNFFSAGNALNILIGGVAGFGGALIGSGAHYGFGGKTMPVLLGQQDFAELYYVTSNPIVNGQQAHFITFNPEEARLVADNRVYQLNAHDPTVHDVIDVHGSGRFVFPSMAAGYRRPMSAKMFAQYLTANHPQFTAAGGAVLPLKLSVCNAAIPGRLGSVGQTLATGLGRTVKGSLGSVLLPSGAPDWKWVTFT